MIVVVKLDQSRWHAPSMVERSGDLLHVASVEKHAYHVWCWGETAKHSWIQLRLGTAPTCLRCIARWSP